MEARTLKQPKLNYLTTESNKVVCVRSVCVETSCYRVRFLGIKKRLKYYEQQRSLTNLEFASEVVPLEHRFFQEFYQSSSPIDIPGH